MQFTLVPILDKMERLYQMPRTKARFDAYLLLLQGPEKQDMILPIAGYNPMGKENVLEKIQALKGLKAEQLIQKEIDRINQETKAENTSFQIVINLGDDVGGSWSSLYTTDFTNKFRMGSLIKRNFCTPYFWTSEFFSKDLIIKKTRASAYRTIYWWSNGQPISLKEHLEQEIFVQKHSFSPLQQEDVSSISSFYQSHQASTDYNLIFNFFYGDEASKHLNYTCYGMPKYAGFKLAQHMAI